MIIGIWSPNHGIGASAAAAAISSALAKLGKNVLLTQTNFSMNNLDYMLYGDNVDAVKEMGKGIDYAVRAFKRKRFKSEGRADALACIKPIADHLFSLPGTAQTSAETYESKIACDTIKRMLPALSGLKDFDYVVVDTNAGQSELTKDVLSVCDVIIVTMRQSPKMIDAVLHSIHPEQDSEDGADGLSGLFANKAVLYVYSIYDRKSKYNIENTVKLSDYKGYLTLKNLVGIPRSTAYKDAIDTGDVVTFLTRVDTTPEKEFVIGLTDVIDKLFKITNEPKVKNKFRKKKNVVKSEPKQLTRREWLESLKTPAASVSEEPIAAGPAVTDSSQPAEETAIANISGAAEETLRLREIELKTLREERNRLLSANDELRVKIATLEEEMVSDAAKKNAEALAEECRADDLEARLNEKIGECERLNIELERFKARKKTYPRRGGLSKKKADAVRLANQKIV